MLYVGVTPLSQSCKSFSAMVQHLFQANLFMKIIGSILLFMVPSFLRQSNKTKPKGSPAPEPNAKHLALDGVRGIASFSIFYLHFSDLFFVPRHNFGYGSSIADNKFYQLPFVHYFCIRKWKRHSLLCPVWASAVKKSLLE